MWGHAHDEYASRGAPAATSQPPTKVKRPIRPKRNLDDPQPEISPVAPASKHKYRGKGKTADQKKSNPWTHAHDEYSQKNKRTNGNDPEEKSSRPSQKRGNRSKPQRPVRSIRFEDDDNHPEEKSNRPLKKTRSKVPKRPKKGRSYVSANEIHAQQFRSASRPKPSPPAPRNNKERVAYGKAQFDAMIIQAATREGLDKSDVRVQRMIQRVGEQMSNVSGFNRFLQNKDAELAKIVSKQDKRRKTMTKMQKNMQRHEKSPSHHEDEEYGKKFRKGSVKDLTARFEKKSVSNTRRQRHGNRRGAGQAHRNALKLPNTKSHRRRVSSQFSVAAISAVLSANSSKPTSQPYLDAHLNLEDNLSNLSHMSSGGGHDGHHTLGVSDRRMSRESRASFSRNSRISLNAPSVIRLGGDNELIITTPGPDGDGDVASSVDLDGAYGSDPLKMLFDILKREPLERSEEELDILVSFFENYQIMTEDVDVWSGKATFRSFICQTRYKEVPAKQYIFREGDDGDVFYFVLRGNVSVLVEDASIVHCGTGSQRNVIPKQEIHIVEENHVFGEIAMFNQGKRSATCVAKTDTYLAYWDRATYDEFIRPMKELKKKAQKILRDKQGKMLSEDQLIEKAAMFLDDAMNGRELKMHRNGPWPRRIHKLINHKYFNYCLVMVSLLYLALIFIEPPSYKDSLLSPDSKYFDRIMPLIAFEWFVFLIFCAECGLRFYSFGRSWFFTIDLHVTRVILLIILGCDLIIACIYQGYAFRFSRFVRPVFPILFIRDLRRQYYIVLACIPYIVELIFLWCIICAIFARIAYHIFYHSEGHLEDGVTPKSIFMPYEFAHGLYPYDEKMSSYCSAALDDDSMKNCGDFLDAFVWASFDTFFKACIALFALLTSENFPEVWWPTWLSNDGHPYWSFFVTYALISIFFLLNLFSAAVYDAYQHIISKLDVIEEKRETQALKVAWICLDTGDAGAIGLQKFESLMYRLKPEYSEFEIGVIFKLLDPDNNHLIDADEFSVMMINVLYLSISRKTRSKDDELKLYLQRLGGSCPFGYEILRAFTSPTWRYIMLVIQSVDIIALLCYHQYPQIFNVTDFLCILIILLALVLDVIFKHMSDLSTYFKSSRNRLYFGLTLLQTIGTLVGIFNDRELLSALRFFGMLRILIVAIFSLEKITFLRTSLTRTITQTVIYMIPVFCRICVHVSVVLLYVYAVIGIELFVDPDPSTHGADRCDAPQQIQSNPYALFCDAQMTIITLIQILTTNNWHIIMYTAIEMTDNWYYPTAYFITFFFLGPILLLSLVLAVFFNMFFGVTVQSENALSAFLHETDMEAKKLQDHMELQDAVKKGEQLQDADGMNRTDVPLPTECGISDLPNGHKILTIRRQDIENGGGDTQTESNIAELVHIPLHQVAREIWEHIPGQDWVDAENQTFKQTFNGREATQFLLNATFAQDEEDAVETLTVIMDEYGAFMRVDARKAQEFENDIGAHYQWIMVPEDEEENAFDDLQHMSEDEAENDEVALEDIMIGFRHSYGGYHRLLKQYRQAGIDPAQEAARAKAEREKAKVPETPISQIGMPKGGDVATPISPKSGLPVINTINAADNTTESNNNNNNNKTIELVKDLPHHIRNKSQKLIKKLNKKTTGENDEDGTIIKSINIAASKHENHNNINNELAKNSNSSNLHVISSTAASPPLPYGASPAHASPPLVGGSLAEKNKSNAHHIKTDSKRKLYNGNFNEDKKESDREAQLPNTTVTTALSSGSDATKPKPPAKLTKSKSSKLIGGGAKKSRGGLQRTASSKNILLRHLDNKPARKGGLF